LEKTNFSKFNNNNIASDIDDECYKEKNDLNLSLSEEDILEEKNKNKFNRVSKRNSIKILNYKETIYSNEDSDKINPNSKQITYEKKEKLLNNQENLNKSFLSNEKGNLNINNNKKASSPLSKNKEENSFVKETASQNKSLNLNTFREFSFLNLSNKNLEVKNICNKKQNINIETCINHEKNPFSLQLNNCQVGISSLKNKLSLKVIIPVLHKKITDNNYNTETLSIKDGNTKNFQYVNKMKK